jgi:hypothetical protein
MWPFKKKCEIPDADILKAAIKKHNESENKEYTKYIAKVRKDYKKYVVARINKAALIGWTHIYPPRQAGFEDTNKDDNFNLFNNIQFDLLDKGYTIEELYIDSSKPSMKNIYLYVVWRV